MLDRLGAGRPASEFETETLDFKRPDASIKKTLEVLADAAICFANARGGTIVLGVDDKAVDRSGALVGADAEAYSVERIQRGIFDRTRPSLTLLVEDFITAGNRFVTIQVPAGVEIYANASGLALKRLGTECRPFPPIEQREVLIARGAIDWSAEPSQVGLDAIAPSQVDRFRTLLVGAGQDELARMPDQRMLEALRLLTERGTLTNAALLLLGRDDALHDFLPTHGYSYQFRPAPGRESTQFFRGEKPLLEAIDLLLNAVEVRTEIKPLNLRGGQQLQLIDYPSSAVREVVVNGFLHRSYELPGSVDVEHTLDHLTVSSPGSLVAGVTPENILTHSATPRNRLLAEVIARLRIAERTGQGIDRAYREMLRIGKQPPGVHSDLSVRVFLRGGTGNEPFVRFVSALPTGISTDVEVLLVLAALRSLRSINAERVGALIQRSPEEAGDLLRRMADDEVGLLETTKRSARLKHPSYRLRSEPLAQLGRAVTYGVRTLDETDRKVVEHIKEFGYVTNATLQRMFDVHVYTARDMLNDLRKRGLVVKIGDAAGGRGVKYGSGPAFPSSSSPPSKSGLR